MSEPEEWGEDDRVLGTSRCCVLLGVAIIGWAIAILALGKALVALDG